MSSSIATKSPVVKQFGELFLKGLEQLTRACQLYVKAIDENPEVKEEFEEAYPDVPASAWKRFEAVGRGSLHPKLLTNMSSAAKRLERCSYSEQTKYVDKPVEVLLANGDLMQVEIRNLTMPQVRQVFNADHVRSIAEQRAYLETIKTGEALAEAKAKGKATAKPYRIVHGKLVIGDLVFDRDTVLHILIEMEKMKK